MSFTYGSYSVNSSVDSVTVRARGSVDAAAFDLSGGIAAQFAVVVQPGASLNGGLVEVQPLRDTDAGEFETAPTESPVVVPIPQDGNPEARASWVLPATFGGAVLHRIYNKSDSAIVVTLRQRVATS